MRKYYDITVPYCNDIPRFPNDKVDVIRIADMEKGDPYNQWTIECGTHTGTHVDAPRHFIRDGKTIEQIPYDRFLGEAKVFEIPGKRAIEVQDIQNFDIREGDRIFFKTYNSKTMLEGKKFREDYAYVTPEAAQYLVQKKIRTLGFDWLAVEMYGSKDFGAHKALLGAEITIIEGCRLKDVPTGTYEMVGLPIKIPGGNGSPITILLFEQNG